MKLVPHGSGSFIHATDDTHTPTPCTLLAHNRHPGDTAGLSPQARTLTLPGRSRTRLPLAYRRLGMCDVARGAGVPRRTATGPAARHALDTHDDDTDPAPLHDPVSVNRDDPAHALLITLPVGTFLLLARPAEEAGGNHAEELARCP